MRAEQIITNRAKHGFPPVSKAVLHRDGSITERSSAELARSYAVRAFLSIPPEKMVEITLDAVKKKECKS